MATNQISGGADPLGLFYGDIILEGIGRVIVIVPDDRQLSDDDHQQISMAALMAANEAVRQAEKGT